MTKATGPQVNGFLVSVVVRCSMDSLGNGWAAAGMLRVVATMKNSPYSKDFSSQQKDLASWVKEIHTAMFANIVRLCLAFPSDLF
jgi:hypothetical protein